MGVSFSQENPLLPAQEALSGFTVYLIHFDKPYKHARHYLGYSYHLERRLQQHSMNKGARLMEVIQQAGITWHVSRTWDGGRELETALKSHHHASRLCPTCIQERIVERVFSNTTNPNANERTPLRREARIQQSLWEE